MTLHREEVLFKTTANWVFLLALIAGCGCFVAGGVLLLGPDGVYSTFSFDTAMGWLNIILFGSGIAMLVLELLHPIPRLTATKSGLTVRRGATVRSYGPIPWRQILLIRTTGGQQNSVLQILLSSPESVRTLLGDLPVLIGRTSLKHVVPVSVNMAMERPEHILSELERIHRQYR